MVNSRHGWPEIGHDDGPGELAGASLDDIAQGISIAQMEMPVVRLSQVDGLHGEIRVSRRGP